MSSQTQNTAGSRALQTDRETRGNNWPIMALVLTTVLDRAITILHFGYESNPIVSELGVGLWTAVTIAFIPAAVVVWYFFQLYRITWMRVWVVVLSALTFLAFLTNVYVVYLL